MVNAREAALAAACRAVVRAFRDGQDPGAAASMAADALKVKSRPSRRRAVVEVRGGAAWVAWADRGVKVTIKDYDNCPDCGGVRCQGGHVQPCPAARQ